MIDFLLTAIVSILFVVDPAGALPAYLVMTANDDAASRRRSAWKASLIATLALAIFASAGQMVFRRLGLTMPAFQIAGGLILFLVALDMLRAQRPTQEGPEEVSEGTTKPDVTVTPLAIPMLAGPAALSTVVVLMSRTRQWYDVWMVYLAIAIAGVVTYLTLRCAEVLYRTLGKTGIRVLSRVLGLILAGIAIQFVLDGLQASGIAPR